jgi:tRNA guanosine-2'-O-methyltransferase
MQGHLFTKSIQRNGKTIISSHGEELAEFCKRLTLVQSNRLQGRHTATILKYLVDNSNKLHPHATLFILQGLDSNKTWKVTLEHAEWAVDLPYKTAFSQIQRVVMLRHCIEVASRLKAKQIDSSSNEAERRRHLESRLSTLRQLAEKESLLYLNKINRNSNGPELPVNVKPTAQSNVPLSTSSKSQPQTRIAQISIDGNVEERSEIAYTHLEHQRSLMDANENPLANWADIQSSNWTALVDGDTPQAQWAETPKQFLGSRCLASIAKNASSQFEVTDYTANYVKKLFDLVSGKTFLWKPLAEAVRHLYFHFPEFLQKSDNVNLYLDVDQIPNLLAHPQIEDVLLRFVNDPPLPRPEFLLDAGITSRELDESGHHIFNVFADETTGHACIFDMLNRLKPTHAAWGLRLLDRILQPWLEQKDPVPMVSKWKRSAQAQAMVILLQSCIHTPEDAQKYWDRIFTILALEPHPRFRFLLEWILVSLSQRITVLNHAENSETGNVGFQKIIAQLKAADHSNPKHVSALIKVAMQLALCPPVLVPAGSNLETLNLDLLTELIALSASPRIPIRHEAQWSFPILFAHCDRNQYTSIVQNPAFAAMNSFIKTLDKYNCPPEAKVLGSFDASKDFNLATLFEGGYLCIHPSELPLLRVEDFEEIWARDRSDSETLSDIPPLGLPLGKWERRKFNHALPSRDVDTQEEAHPSGKADMRTAPLQTKSLSLDSSFKSLDLDEAPQQATYNGPILVASLIENPHNLGGLSRASEIFGCTSLLIPDLTVLKNQQFRNVSVNSELHITLEELKETDLVAYLRGKKRDGWTVVGVEQTDTSIIIGTPDAPLSDSTDGYECSESIATPDSLQTRNSKPKSLPEKSIIIMGAEKTGIPAEVLIECDVCVEIKQWGVTRSLNVQTAAACVLFEWRRIWGDGR